MGNQVDRRLTNGNWTRKGYCEWCHESIPKFRRIHNRRSCSDICQENIDSLEKERFVFLSKENNL